MKRHIILPLFLFLPAAFGQGFDAGVKVGVPVTNFFDTGSSGSVHGSSVYSSATRRYTLGLSGEWWLTHAFGFEVDAMYHRLGYTGTAISVGTGGVTDSVLHVTGNAWDFPLLAKYRFGHILRPYVAGGGTLRYIGPVHGQGEQTNVTFPTNVTVINTDSPVDLNKRVYPGLTAAGGLEFGVGRFKLLPELRYTRWTANISGSNGVLRFAPNQLEFLLGFDLATSGRR
jgi:hypothetical protein